MAMTTYAMRPSMIIRPVKQGAFPEIRTFISARFGNILQLPTVVSTEERTVWRIGISCFRNPATKGS